MREVAANHVKFGVSMTREELKQHLEHASKNGTLMTPKHDPANLSTTYNCFRTVLSFELAQNLEGFFLSGESLASGYKSHSINWLFL